MNRRILGRTYFDAPVLFQQADPPQGGGSNNPPAQPSTQPKETDVQKLVDAILNSQRASGDANKALEVFAGQIIAKDKRIADLEAKVIKDEDAALLTSVRELLQVKGAKDFSDLKTRYEEGEAAIGERDDLKQQATLSSAAKALKLQDNALLHSLLKGVAVEVKGEGEAQTVTVDGKSFEDYAKTRPELQDALPALKATPEQPGRRVPAQNPGGNDGKPLNPYEQARQEVKQKQQQEAPQERDLKLAGIH